MFTNSDDTPKLKPTTEILQYRGYTIYMENYKYWIGLNPFQKYISLTQAKKEIDKIEEMFNENIQKLPTIYNSREQTLKTTNEKDKKQKPYNKDG